MSTCPRSCLTIAFMLLRMTSPASAQAKPASDSPLLADSRMQQAVTVIAPGKPLGEILEALGKQTGIRLMADPAVANDRFVIYSRNRPLSATLATLAREYGLDWRRAGNGPEYSYTIFQSADAVLAEQRSIELGLQRSLDQLKRDLTFCNSLAGMSTDELRTQAQNASLAVQAEQNPNRRWDLSMESLKWLEVQRDPGRYVLAAKALSTWSDDDLRQALATYSYKKHVWSQSAGSNTLPLEIASEIIKLVTEKIGDAPQGRYNEASVQVRGAPDESPRLSVTLEAASRDGIGVASRAAVVNLPFGAQLNERTESPTADEIANSSLASSLRTPLRFTFEYERPTREKRTQILPAPALSDAIAAYQTALPTDIISDAYWGDAPHSIRAEDVPAAQVLGQIASFYKRSWQISDGFVVLRKPTRAFARRAEPPVHLRNWLDAAASGKLGMDQLAELADLPVEQYKTTAEVISRAVPFAAMSQIARARGCLMLWHRLTGEQRQHAAGEGVAYSSLPPEMQKLYVAVSTDQLIPGMVSSQQDYVWDPAKLAHSTFRFTQRRTPGWGYMNSSGSINAAGGQPRENALAAFKTNNAVVTDKDLFPVNFVFLEFRFVSSERPEVFIPVMLPVERVESK